MTSGAQHASGKVGKRIFIVAGEASGDLHGGNLVRELFQLANGSVDQYVGPAKPVGGAAVGSAAVQEPLLVRAWGGDRMSAAGAEVIKHYRDLAFMGFTQVLANLRTILRNIKTCQRDIAEFDPDALVLIDYPGFNMRIAAWAHARGIPVHWYISPQVWAWKKGRVHALKRTVDRMYVILPFEKEWYAGYGMDVDFVGHPLLDAIAREGQDPLTPLPGKDPRPVVALLPGSRRQEIAGMLPMMAATAKRFPDHRFIVAAASSVPASVYEALVGDAPVEVLPGRTYDVLRHARAALVTSGTATLETALFGVPEVVCYRGGALNVWLARRLVDVKYISLVNLIMDRELVPELIQSDLSPKRLEAELGRILPEGEPRQRMVKGLAELRDRLGGPGASAKTAAAVWKSLH